MSEIDLLAEAVRDFYLRAHATMDRQMAAAGASLARAKLLMLIDAKGPMRSADIAQATGHSPRTVTEAIDGLERDGLLRRDPDPDDRRAKRISLTDTGRDALAAVEPIRRALTERVFGALDAEERRAFTAVMAKLIAQLDA